MVVLVLLFWYKSVVLVWLTVHWIAYYDLVERAPLLSPYSVVSWMFVFGFLLVGWGGDVLVWFLVGLFVFKDTVSRCVACSTILPQAVWS